MPRTRTLSALLLASALLPAAPTDALGQRARPTPSATLVPYLGGGTMGHRWEHEGSSFGPGSALFAGAALHYPVSATVSAELLGGYAWGSSYSVEYAEEARSVGAGDIDLLRIGLGALWKMRADVPGYFSVGVGALHYAPDERIVVQGGTTAEGEAIPDEPLFADRAEWMPSAHVGAGIDITSGDHTARLDVRVYGSRSRQDIQRFGAEFFTPRLAFDVQFFVGYVLRL